MAISPTLDKKILSYLKSLPKNSIISKKALAKKFNISQDALNTRINQVNKNFNLNIQGAGIGGSLVDTSTLSKKEQNIFKNNYKAKTISQMATDITGLPYDNKITKAKSAQLYRYYLTQSRLGNILKGDMKMGTRPKGSTPADLKGFGGYRKAQADLIKLDPKTYGNLTPAQVDSRLKKALNFSTVRGAFNVPKSLTPSFEHFQGIVPGTISQDPNALRKVGITTQDFNFNVLGAKAQNNIYKTIKNNLRTAKEFLTAGNKKEAKKSLDVVNEIYGDIAKKVKYIDRKQLPFYNLKGNNLKEVNLKALKLNDVRKLDDVVSHYVKFVATGPSEDIKKIDQPNLKKAVKLIQKGDESNFKKLVSSRIPSILKGGKFAIPGALIGGAMASGMGGEAEAAITYNPTIGALVKTGSDDIATQSNVLEWAAKNPEASMAGTATAGLGMTKPGSAVLKGLLKTLAAPAVGAGYAALDVKENLDEGESLPEALADKSAGLSLMGSRALMGGQGLGALLGGAKIARSLTPVGAAMTAAGIGKDYYDWASEEIERLEGMTDYERQVYSDSLMDETNIDF